MSFDFEQGGKKAKKSPGFMAAASSAPDPLAGVEYSESVESDSASELTALEAAFKERRGVEDKRFQQATDSEFWVALCFRSREAKEAFLAATSTSRLGDKYVDGHAFAKALGVDLPD